ncbi:chaperonin 10-like protein [Corynascus novoguineensis]|uniref:Chaperonin 10-like protein n=1 Tax=Corynascus novoguineensis TaxID=1126955 RepID=A0AAN7CYP9_9PEZI|nr:chaperonin 10-like protein [Corynascus novoguineensis]
MASLPAFVPATHPAVAITSPGKPLQLINLPTIPPSPGEVLVHVTHTSSSPLDLHRASGDLHVHNNTPFVMGITIGGTVVAVGPNTASGLRVGDRVFGFVNDGSEREAGFQAYATVPAWKLGRVPEGIDIRDAVAVPANLVTAVHTVVQDLGLPLPWPVVPPVPSSAAEKGRAKEKEDKIVLVWGAASSVGMYVLQVLRHWGYRHVLAVASGKHHEALKELGARQCFDYREGDVVGKVLGYLEGLEKKENNKEGRPRVPYIVDCIGSKEGTLRPLTRIADKGSRVAVMLPVINVHTTKDQKSELEMDVGKVLVGEWKNGVELRGVRTFLYHQNEFFKHHLQPEIVPALLEQRVIKPNKLRMVEGKTLLDRAQKALDLLRDQAVSGEKLVWRVADDIY